MLGKYSLNVMAYTCMSDFSPLLSDARHPALSMRSTPSKLLVFLVDIYVAPTFFNCLAFFLKKKTEPSILDNLMHIGQRVSSTTPLRAGFAFKAKSLEYVPISKENLHFYDTCIFVLVLFNPVAYLEKSALVVRKYTS